LKQDEHLPLLQERFPAWVKKVEFWHIDDAPEVLGMVEKEVMGLMARILGGGERQDSCPNTANEAPVSITRTVAKPASANCTPRPGNA